MPSARARRRLLNAVHTIAEASSLETVATVAVSAARDVAKADGADLIVRDGTLCHQVAEEGLAPQISEHRLPLATCVAGRALALGEDVVIEDTGTLLDAAGDLTVPDRVASLAAIADRAATPAIAIGVYWASRTSPSQDQVHLLKVLADSVAAARQRLEAWAECAGHALPTADTVRMCAWTRRIQLEGEWVSVETFLLRRFGLRVTHGLSDEARDLLIGPREPTSDEGK